MADAVTAVCTEKRGLGAGDAYEPGTVYTRTFTFPVLASATGYGASDVITLVTVPANTQILSIASKASAAQSTGATFAYSIDSGSAMNAVHACTTANVFVASDMTEANACTANTDGVLKCTIGTQTCDAATITVTMVCASLGSEAAPYSTFTN